MSDLRKRRDELVKEYLQRNDGNVLSAIEDLRKAYKELPTPVLAFEALAYLNARSFLEDSLE